MELRLTGSFSVAPGEFLLTRGGHLVCSDSRGEEILWLIHSWRDMMFPRARATRLQILLHVSFIGYSLCLCCGRVDIPLALILYHTLV